MGVISIQGVFPHHSILLTIMGEEYQGKRDGERGVGPNAFGMQEEHEEQ